MCAIRSKTNKYLYVIFGLILLLVVPVVFVDFWNNACMIHLNRWYNQKNEHPLKRGWVESGLRFAANIMPYHFTARWTLGQLAFAAGDTRTATRCLESIISDVPVGHLVYKDLVLIYSYDGQHDQVITAYNSGALPNLNQSLSDAIALAYFETSDKVDLSERWDRLLQARTVRPIDLYANYALLRQDWQEHNIELQTSIDTALKSFPLQALSPGDDRLFPYVTQALLGLLERQIWDKDRVLNCVAYLVWQEYEQPAVEDLLSSLSEQYPSEPEWPFYWAELSYRRGELSKAEELYKRTAELAGTETYLQAYLRLGLVVEENCDPPALQCMAQATEWYAQYNELVPGDVLGLQKLAESCEWLDAQHNVSTACETASGRMKVYVDEEGLLQNSNSIIAEALKNQTDERCIVAQLMGMPVQYIELGPNMVEDGGYEKWEASRPSNWCWAAMFNKEPFGEGLFGGGQESLFAPEGHSTARVQGFWAEKIPGKSSPRAGFLYCAPNKGARFIALLPRRYYLLSFKYKTVYAPGYIWLSSENYSSGNVWFQGDYSLENTAGEWRQFAVVDFNPADFEHLVSPLFRLYGPGQLEVDRFQIREITIMDGVPLTFRLPAFWSSGVSVNDQ